MPIYRNVSKTDASTPEAAAEFIRQDTGGSVTHASGFAVIDEGDCWRVPVFSMDGHAATGRSERRPVEDSANNEYCYNYGSFGFGLNEITKSSSSRSTET